MKTNLTDKPESRIGLQEFCDMNQLYKLIENWSKCSGMSAVIVDNEGKRTSESFGMTDFCSMVHNSSAGDEICSRTWRNDTEGIYICPMGFCDFSVPIVLPDGRQIGKVLAGQALSVEQPDSEIINNAVRYGMDADTVKELLVNVHRKTEEEMHGAYVLLREMLRFFVEKSYSIWKTNDYIRKLPAKKDRILSQITQIMYSYNLTVDLETGSYTLITGR